MPLFSKHKPIPNTGFSNEMRGGRDPVPVFVANASYNYAKVAVSDRVWILHLPDAA